MNEQIKSEGVKLLEAVIQSNEKNINIINSLKNQISDSEISTEYLSLLVEKLGRESKNIEIFIEKDLQERKLFLEKLPKSIEAKMSTESQKTLDSFIKQLKIIQYCPK